MWGCLPCIWMRLWVSVKHFETKMIIIDTIKVMPPSFFRHSIFIWFFFFKISVFDLELFLVDNNLYGNLYGQIFQFGNHMISSLLFADDTVLIMPGPPACTGVVCSQVRSGWEENQQLHVWGCGSQRQNDACPLQVGGEVLPQVEEFKLF